MNQSVKQKNLEANHHHQEQEQKLKLSSQINRLGNKVKLFLLTATNVCILSIIEKTRLRRLMTLLNQQKADKQATAQQILKIRDM